ncbi:YbjQ family protein [Streptomyces sp. NRRL B-1322]|uniref:YbjQ family protein n=1 Tax=Streptomyces sp. NRRL B-1322 TaxID=1463828 RepID=UPI000ABCD8C2|nr:YbjQ family protein [Streptomyces sp. NRRL B-1322]
MGIDDYGGGAGAHESGVLVVTTNDVPGYRVERVIGEVFGLTVRSRHLGSQIGAGLKSMIGGELKGLTKTLVQTRNQAMDRLVEQAKARGARCPHSTTLRVASLVRLAILPLGPSGLGRPHDTTRRSLIRPDRQDTP